MSADHADFNHSFALKGKRIIFVFGNLELGGAERQGLLLAQYLSEHEQASVEVWGFNRAGPVSSICEQHGLTWRVVPFYFKEKLASRLNSLMELARHIRAARPDILLPYTLIPNVACGLIWKLTGARACVWNQRDAGIARLDLRWERRAARLTSRFISNSQQGARFLTDEMKAHPSKVKLIVNGVELPAPLLDRAAWRDQLQLDERSFVACMVANLHSYKDHETLLKAWRIVATRLKAQQRDAFLILAGRHDDAYESLLSLTHELCLDHNVIYAGHVTDVAGLLSATDICVFSSRSEGCPNGILESMAAGLAVVGTDVEGIQEAVGLAGAKFLAPPGDAEALANIILKLSDNPALRSHLGNENRKRVREHYSVTRMCEETVSLIANCLQL
jgi:glycosyltransferase involved in cell wall biosynthesis